MKDIYFVGSNRCHICTIILNYLKKINEDKIFNIKYYDIMDRENLSDLISRHISVPAIYIYDDEKYIKLNNAKLLNEAILYYNVKKGFN